MPDKRLTADWLASYLDLTSHLEAPESLHLWTGLSLISSATRRNVYLDMNYERVFPNLYVIIVAESAKSRKSQAMDFGKDLLTETLSEGIRIMQDSMTSQGLIKELNHKVQIVKDGKIQEELRSDVSIFADEVANLFGYDRVRAAQMSIFLTRTYKCPVEYDHTTVRDSKVRLHNLFTVLLGGTEPKNLKVLPQDTDGFPGRCIWVIENSRRGNNPGWIEDEGSLPTKKQLLREYLIHDLRRISQLKGNIKVEADARNMYTTWYKALSEKDGNDPATNAFYNRCHTTALRLLTLLTLSSGDTLIATTKQMRGAITLIEAQLPEIKRVDMWKGASIYEQHRAKFLHFLQQCPNGVTTDQKLLKYMGVSSEDYAKIKQTLIADGSVENGPKLGSHFTVRLTQQGAGQEVKAEGD